VRETKVRDLRITRQFHAHSNITCTNNWVPEERRPLECAFVSSCVFLVTPGHARTPLHIITSLGTYTHISRTRALQQFSTKLSTPHLSNFVLRPLHYSWQQITRTGETNELLSTAQETQHRTTDTRRGLVTHHLRILSSQILLCVMTIAQLQLLLPYHLFHDSYYSPNIISGTKSRMVRCGHAARIGAKRGAYRVSVEKPEICRYGRPRRTWVDNTRMDINPLNAELNLICHLVALLEAHLFSTLAG
jgi:hypothetical protein